jgi:hypothetical protein
MSYPATGRVIAEAIMRYPLNRQSFGQNRSAYDDAKRERAKPVTQTESIRDRLAGQIINVFLSLLSGSGVNSYAGPQ